MTADIILIRHGQTRSNVNRYYMGCSSEDLDPEGLNQVKKVSGRLEAVSIAAVYSSPLTRALTTAREVAKPHNLEIKVLDDLTEIGLGEWQGLHISEIEKRWPDLWRQWRTDPSKMTIPGGETFSHIDERVSQAMKTVISEGSEALSIVVSHEIVIKLAIMQTLGAPLYIYRHFVVGNASVSLIRVRGDRQRVITVNDTSHLEAQAFVAAR